MNNVEFVTEEIEAIVRDMSKVVLEKLSKAHAQNSKRNCNQTALGQCVETPPNIVKSWTENINRRTSDCLLLTYDKVNYTLQFNNGVFNINFYF